MMEVLLSVRSSDGAQREDRHALADSAEKVPENGHPDYYPRFGFVCSKPLGIEWEGDAPAEAFMVLELQEGALASREGIARYLPEFEGA